MSEVYVDIAEARRARKQQAAGEPTDDALALRFAEQYPNMRYVELRGRWLRWSGQRWEPDSTGHTFADVRDMLREVAVNEGKRAGWLLSAQRVAAVERLARYDRRLAATIEQWDADDWLLNTPNGLIDLRTGQQRQHDPLAYCTKITGTEARGLCPRWLAFLDEVTAGNQELVDFLQRVVGYCLTGLIREHALFFFYGTGGNGKGVFLNTLAGVLGNYATVAGMDTFTESKHDRHPADLAALQGARFVVAQETEEGRRWAESRIKTLTGGDPVTARFMRQDFFTFMPKFKLVIAGNHKPRLRNPDEAMRRRLHLIPFTVSIPAERRDPDLAQRLREEWPGILQWAVDGCRAYLADGLNPPAIVKDATADYFTAQDLFGQWIEDSCEVGADHWETPNRLFTSWKAYADKANERPGERTTFNERMHSAGFAYRKDRHRGRYWTGLKVASQPFEDDFAAPGF